jgi:glucokinase
MSAMILVGDTGGTNTRFGLFYRESGQVTQIRQYRNAAFEHYESAVEHYLEEAGVKRVSMSVLAFAAPIINDNVSLTNHNWTITKSAVVERIGGSATVFLNDLAALAWSIDLVPPDGIESLDSKPNSPARGGRLVIGIGTGFNTAVREDGGDCCNRPAVRVAESGHITLPIETAEELSLRDWLSRGRGRASIERALSGIGIGEVYHWACAELGQPTEPLSGAEITARAIASSNPACIKTCEILTRFAARIAGDLAMAYLPFGGIYLAGSVTQALLPMFRQSAFRAQFNSKGRQSSLMENFNLNVITNGTAALFGCAAYSLTFQL